MRKTAWLLPVALILALCLNVFSFAAGFGLGWMRHDGTSNTASQMIEVPPTLPSDTPVTNPTAAVDADVLTDAKLGLLGEAWGYVQSDFYSDDPIDYTKVNYDMIRGMVGALDDPYTRFVEPPQAELDRSDYEGKFGGIGAYIGMNDEGQPYISGVIAGNPAEEAGILEGDVILEVDGKPVDGLTQDEVVLMVRGPIDSQVLILVQRAAEPNPLSFSVRRAEIKLPTVTWEPVDDGRVAHIVLDFFAAPSGDELATALKEARDAGISQAILDLRGNPGGLLSAAGDVTAQFVKSGVLLYEMYRAADGGTQEESYMIPHADQAYPGVALVLLVDGGTASASEIVAGALQDYGRAALIGATTYGKGSMQYVHELSDKSSLRVTAAHWLTPNRRPINGVGLTPDIEVTMGQDDLDAGRDPQLDAAISYLAERR